MNGTPSLAFDPAGIPIPWSWDEYAEFISGAMQIVGKFNIMALLNTNMAWIMDSTECPGIWKVIDRKKFSDDGLYDLKSIISIQILSLAYELTENFAAICFAYAEAVDHGAKFFPLLIRDFGMPLSELKKRGCDKHGIDIGRANAGVFYRSMSDPASLKRYVGEPNLRDLEVQDLLVQFRQLSSYRERFDRWYNKYKHAHGTIPIRLEGKVDNQDFKWFILHRVPDYLAPTDPQVRLKEQIPGPVIRGGVNLSVIETESFLSPMELLNTWAPRDVGQIVVALWQRVRRTQHKRLFGKEAP